VQGVDHDLDLRQLGGGIGPRGDGLEAGNPVAQGPRRSQQPVLELGVHLELEIGNGLAHLGIDPLALGVGEAVRANCTTCRSG
jgi:hypothetical protein